MLEMNLQLCILSHMPHTLKIFSGSRLEKLFGDLTTFIQSPFSSDHIYNAEQKSLLRTLCWKGVRMCVEEASLVSEDLLPSFENCVEVLFSLLPEGSRLRSLELSYEGEEWSGAVRCLGKARHKWLSHCLQIEEMSFSQDSHLFSETKKKMIAKARLVEIGSIPLIELSQLKPYILNTRSDAIWEVLVEVVMALQHVEGSIKRPWLVDAAEISRVTSYQQAIQFIGLLCGSVSKYMPLLTVNPHTVLSDLPVTLTSLLLDNSNWGMAAESVVSLMWTSTQRIYSWVSNEDDFSSQQSLDEPDTEVGVFLLKVMHLPCVTLKEANACQHDPPLNLYCRIMAHTSIDPWSFNVRIEDLAYLLALFPLKQIIFDGCTKMSCFHHMFPANSTRVISRNYHPLFFSEDTPIVYNGSIFCTLV